MEQDRDTVQPSKLTYIPTELIHRNPHNPRTLFDLEPMRILLESISEVSILVPLLIYQRPMDGEYVILDGERRWLCAKELGLRQVPANVIEEPTQMGNILTMFNIHNVREPWELMPTALKLEVVMRELGTESEVRLAKLTSLNRANVRRCKILLSYDKSYQDMMLVADPGQRIKADFFIEMHPVLRLIERRLPEVSEEFPGNRLIDVFLDKYSNKELSSVLDFRKIAAAIRNIDKGTPRNLVISELLRFLKQKKSDLAKFISAVDIFRETQTLKRSCQLLVRRISSFEYFPDSSDTELKAILLQLKELIEAKLKSMESQ